MKILKKRAIACLIDSFLFGIILVLFSELLKSWGVRFNNVELILFIPFFMRDIMFRNASIGKRMLGISVYDTDWKKPKLSHLMKRSFFMMGVGYVIYWKSKLTDGNAIDVVDYERETLNSYVIDNKVYKKLADRAGQMDGDFSTNMSCLYNEYLRNLYMK